MKTIKILLSAGGFTPKPPVVALPPLPNPGCAIALVQSRMNEVHPCDITDKLRAVQLSMLVVGDYFFQELTCNVEPQIQASEEHMVEEFLNEAAFHREQPSPELFKNKILRDLFNVHSLKYRYFFKRDD